MIRTRFAPSPTGFVHVGSIYQTVIYYGFAKKNNGKFILRLEDTDKKRYKEGAEEALYRALEWIKIIPDEGPIYGGDYGPYVQSEVVKNGNRYKKYAYELLDKGIAYRCFCSSERLEKMREDQLKNKQQPKYDRTCLRLTEEEIQKKLDNNEKFVIRMKIPDNEYIEFEDLILGKISFYSNQIDDQVILKSDEYPTYHLGVVVDDHYMNITHVIRGPEWLPSTPKHVLLFKFFGWEIPKFAHTQLLRNENRSKMSKRKGDFSMEDLIALGYLPDAIFNFLALLANPNDKNIEIFDREYYINNFDLKKVPKTGPIFDTKKLLWMNGVYIRKLSIEELKNMIKPFISIDMSKKSDEYLEKSLQLIQERLKILSEADELLKFFFVRPEVKITERKDVVKDLINIVNEYANDDIMEQDIRKLAEKYGMKAGDVFMILRDIITGQSATPPIIPVIKVLGKEESIERLKVTIGE